MIRFFEFSNGKNIIIESDTYDEAVKEIKKNWWKNIFEECDFRVVTVNASSIKSK